MSLNNDSEIKFLQRARHPRLVWFLGCGRTDDMNIFVVLEFCADGDLSDFLSSTTDAAALAWPRRLLLLVDVASGMEYLHLVHNSIHRGPSVFVCSIFVSSFFWMCTFCFTLEVVCVTLSPVD